MTLKTRFDADNVMVIYVMINITVITVVHGIVRVLLLIH